MEVNFTTLQYFKHFILLSFQFQQLAIHRSKHSATSLSKERQDRETLRLLAINCERAREPLMKLMIAKLKMKDRSVKPKESSSQKTSKSLGEGWLE
jgi:hypothetical protein